MAARLDVGELYQKYGHSVLRRARQILGSEGEADEVLQELFTGLVAQPNQFDGRCAPSTFLYKATTNACLSRLRDRRNRRRLLDKHVRPWTTDIDPRSVGAALEAREVLAQLPDAEARAAVYHYLDGMSHAEIAKVLKCSRRHVGHLLERVSLRFGRGKVQRDRSPVSNLQWDHVRGGELPVNAGNAMRVKRRPMSRMLVATM